MDEPAEEADDEADDLPDADVGASSGRPGGSDAPGAPHRPTLLVLAGLVGICAAAALVVLASGAPTPSVSIGAGGQLVDSVTFRPSHSVGAARTPAVVSGEIVVDVEGAVAQPGVYRLPAGSRLADVLRAAGGFSSAVDVPAVERDLNLASPIADGAKVRVPALGEASVGPSMGGAATRASSAPRASGGGTVIDLNHASVEELDSLPGVGPVTAAKIVAARTERPFATVDELGERGIVGPATLAKFRELVTAGP